jgi:methyl-accepting chemotaxis protein
VKALGENIAKEHPGMAIRLYSRYPFPHRASTERYDAFEQQALAALEKNPTEPVVAMEEVQGRRSVRYAVADTMRDACVACHNTHPESPKRDWKTGDTRGVVSVTVPIDAVRSQIALGVGLASWTIAGGGVLIALFAYYAARRIGRASANVSAVAHGAVATGDLTVRADQSRADEIGRVAESLNQLLQTQQELISKMRAESDALSSASDHLSMAAEEADQASRVQSEATTGTAAAVEQMAVSISTVSEAAESVVQLARESLHETDRGKDTLSALTGEMQGIDAAVRDITNAVGQFVQHTGSITSMTQQVTDVAEQTNLLALNAAIEAARAGEQGRGFAVVADEVRKLAEKSAVTAKQIDEVTATLNRESEVVAQALAKGAQSLESGQAHVKRVVDALNDARQAVTRAVSGVEGICASVKEQTAASNDIARNVEQIAQMTEKSGASTARSKLAAQDLKSMSTQLKTLVQRFRV